jgi:5-(carboxyamino)imidazole ribonucleotide mutase
VLNHVYASKLEIDWNLQIFFEPYALNNQPMSQSTPPSTAEVAIVMGSTSDLEVMHKAAEVLEFFGVAYELHVLSAHRTPDRMTAYAKEAAGRGLRVLVAGAGGAAHLPGMLAASTPLPVVGVPVRSSNSIDGWDSLLSILQMPTGVPVATVAVNGAANAGLLAVQILATSKPGLLAAMQTYKQKMHDDVTAKDRELQSMGWEAWLKK